MAGCLESAMIVGAFNATDFWDFLPLDDTSRTPKLQPLASPHSVYSYCLFARACVSYNIHEGRLTLARKLADATAHTVRPSRYGHLLLGATTKGIEHRNVK